jgi:hypothetical protein
VTLPPAPAVEIAFEEFLKELPPDYAEMAYEFKAFARARKLKSPAQLLQVAMLYCGLDQALRSTAGSFALWQERITDTAIHRRLKACGPWLKALLHAMLPGTGAASKSLRLLVVDGSSLSGPGAQGTDYRVHLALDLTHMALHAVEVTGVAGAESLTRYPWQPGDVVLADRGYNQPRVILELAERGVRVIVRLIATAMPLYLRQAGEERLDPAAPRWDVAAHLRGVAGDLASVAVWLRGGQASGPGWLHAVRLPPAAADAARQRCRRTAKRKGWTPSAAALELAGWVMVFTTVAPADLDGAAVLDLYRCRWQVEMAFKRLKSLLDLDALRTKRDSLLGEVWILGKLLYALVVERHIARRPERAGERLDRARRATPWRVVVLARRQVDAWILEVHRWRQDNWAACLEVLRERPRRRALQTLPPRAVDLINQLENQSSA